MSVFNGRGDLDFISNIVSKNTHPAPSLIYRPVPAEQWKCDTEVTISWFRDPSVPKGTKVNFFLMDSYVDSFLGDTAGMLTDSYAFKRLLHDKKNGALLGIDYHSGNHKFTLDCDKPQSGFERDITTLNKGDNPYNNFTDGCEWLETTSKNWGWETWPNLNDSECQKAMPVLRQEMTWGNCKDTACNGNNIQVMSNCNNSDQFDCMVHSMSEGRFKGDVNFHWDSSWRDENRPMIFEHLLMERTDRHVYSGNNEDRKTIHDRYAKVVCQGSADKSWPECWDRILPARSLGPVWVVNEYVPESKYPDASNVTEPDYENDKYYDNNYNIWGPKQWMPRKDFDGKDVPADMVKFDTNLYTLAAKAALVVRADMTPNVGKTIDLKEEFGEYEILSAFMEGVLATFILKSKHDNAIVVAFRATEESGMNSTESSTTLPDWFTNFLINPTSCHSVLAGCKDGMVMHGGLMYEYAINRDSVRKTIKDLISGDSSPCGKDDPTQWRIMFSGMSQGGGIANIAYFDILNYISQELYQGDTMATQEKNPFFLHTYGAPPSGNVDFANALQALFPTEEHRDRFVMSFSKDVDHKDAVGWFKFPEVDFAAQKIYADFANFETSPVSDYDRKTYKIPQSVSKVHWVKGDLIAEVGVLDNVVAKDKSKKISMVGADYNATGLSAFRDMDRIDLVHHDSDKYVGWKPYDPSYPYTTGSKSGKLPAGKTEGKGPHRLTSEGWPNNLKGCSKYFCPTDGEGSNVIGQECYPEDGIAGMGDMELKGNYFTAGIDLIEAAPKLNNIMRCPPRNCHTMALYGWGVKEDFKNKNIDEKFWVQTKPTGEKYGCKANFATKKHQGQTDKHHHRRTHEGHHRRTHEHRHHRRTHEHHHEEEQ